MKSAVEKTLLILKPDAVQRGLVGRIIEEFETIGLKMLAAKMVMPDKKVIEGHYPGTKEWIEGMGHKTLASYKDAGLDVKEEMGTDDPYELGQFVYKRLIDYWQTGPVIVMVWEGPHAVQIARKVGVISSRYWLRPVQSTPDISMIHRLIPPHVTGLSRLSSMPAASRRRQ